MIELSGVSFIRSSFHIFGSLWLVCFFFFQAEDGIRDHCVTGVQTCALPISPAQKEEEPAVEELTEEEEEELDLNLEAELAEASSKRIDDPVRMYLTQMGEIPLLTREQEIALAKKIEITRKIFRSRVLESDYCLQAAVEILQQVDDGDLPFDRTMKISTAEDQADKGTIGQRIPTNLESCRRMLTRNRDEW